MRPAGVAVDPSNWAGTDNGTDNVSTQLDQAITSEGLSGVGGSTGPVEYFTEPSRSAYSGFSLVSIVRCPESTFLPFAGSTTTLRRFWNFSYS